MPPNYPQSIDKRSAISSITRNTCSTCHLGFKRRTQVSIVTVNRSRTTPGASPRSRLLCLLFRGLPVINERQASYKWGIWDEKCRTDVNLNLA